MNRAEPMSFSLRYFHALRRLRQQRTHLLYLFDAAELAHSRLLSISERLKDPGAWSPGGALNSPPRASGYDALEVHRGAIDVYAGAVVLVLDDMLASLQVDYREVGGVKDTGPTYAGYPIWRIFKATGNNFRHYEEWRRNSAKAGKKQRADADVIAAVLAHPDPSPSHSTFFYIVARWVLDKLGNGSYQAIELLVRESMDAMLEDLRLETEVHARSARASWGAPYV